jgi:hypothetical protein
MKYDGKFRMLLQLAFSADSFVGLLEIISVQIQFSGFV